MPEFVEVTISIDSDIFDFYKAQLEHFKEMALSQDDENFNVFLHKDITIEKHLEIVLSMNALSQIHE